jgi:hypothetical protein
MDPLLVLSSGLDAGTGLLMHNRPLSIRFFNLRLLLVVKVNLM